MSKNEKGSVSTQSLMNIERITDYSLGTPYGELVYFIIHPTNISVLSESSVAARIYSLMNVMKGIAEIEILCLNSKETFDDNKAFLRERMDEESNPIIRKLLLQDSQNLDRMQVQMATAREFLIIIRLRNEKESDVFSYFIEQLRKTYQEQPTDKLDIEQVQSRIEELKTSTMALIQDSVLSNTVGENESRLKTMSDEIKALSDMITDYKNSQNNINIESTINDLEETLYSEPDQNDEYDDDLVRQLINTIKVVGDDKLIFTFKCGLVYEQPIQLQVRRLKKSA